jgi:hypothetical protein
MRAGSRTRLLAGVLAVAAGCSTPTASGPLVCEPPIAPPAGFVQVGRVESRQADHVGVRTSYRSDDGRELQLLAGIPGEIGEGLPLAGTLRLADGLDARLLGGDERWVLVWGSEGICEPYAVIGEGFDRRSFVGLLREIGLVEPS